MRVCRNDTPSFVLKKETSYYLTGLSQRILILPIIVTAIGIAAIAATATTAGTTSTNRSGGLAPRYGLGIPQIVLLLNSLKKCHSRKVSNNE